MAPSVAPMQLLVSIVERGKGRELREHYRQFGLIHHNQAQDMGLRPPTYWMLWALAPASRTSSSP